MALVPVETALEAVLAGAVPSGSEMVRIEDAGGRVLARPLAALRTQPGFAASAMDGYAVRAQDVASVPTKLTVIGQSAAGHGYPGNLGAGEAVRIFTGAPLPEGADTIVIQEDTECTGHRVTVLESSKAGRFVRPSGFDFTKGDVLLEAGEVLDAPALALAASMNHASVPVVRQPRVAVFATGDELVNPGEEPAADQIIASNGYGVAELVREAGGFPIYLGIARDTKQSLTEIFAKAETCKADVIVSLGGASVGDHDLVHDAFREFGVHFDLWKIAMRPGKPFMFGTKGNVRVLGLPGNPVSSLVCGILFLRPLVRALAGRSLEDLTLSAALGKALPANDQRQDYIRAVARRTPDGAIEVTPFPTQDSSMLAIMARSNCLIIRAPHAPEAVAGSPCQILPISRI